MTPIRTQLARALLLALLLLTLSGSVASADTGSRPAPGNVTTLSAFPDDPGFTP